MKFKYIQFKLLINKYFKKIYLTESYYRKKRIKIRAGSSPYISGDTFRNLADLNLTNNLITNDAQNKIVFWDRIEKNFEEVREIVKNVKFKQQLKLIVHNGDEHLSPNQIKFLLKRFIQIYTTNYLGNNIRVIPIPIGLENYYINMHGNYKLISNDSVKIKNKILVNFNIETNKNFRLTILKFCAENSNLFDIKINIKRKKYFKVLSKYKFVLSPPGNGMDCHRTWEAVYCKVVPIVFDDYFPKRLGDLPILPIKSILDLSHISQNYLDKLYDNLIKKDTKKAYIDYWVKEIKNFN